MSAAATVLDIKTGKKVTDAAPEERKPTRKEKQAARKAAEVAAERARILEEAAKIGRPTCANDRLILAKARLVGQKDKLAELENGHKKILNFLGEFNKDSAEDDFADNFARDFIQHPYTCAVNSCSSDIEAKERVKWILPLSVSVRKTLDWKRDNREFNRRDHGKQWETAVELFHAPEDLQGLVLCENCRAKTEKMLKEKYPYDHPGTHRLYNIDGFAVQLGKNRFRMLRNDLTATEEDIVRSMEEIETSEEQIGELEVRVAQEKAQEKEIDDLIS